MSGWSESRQLKLPRAASASRVLRRSRRRSGNEIIEAALVFPLLLALAFGTVEFGYYFYLEHNLQSAAREGVRAAIPAGLGDGESRFAEAQTAAERVMTASGFPVGTYDLNWEYNEAEEYFRVDVEMNWEDVNEGLRPLRMISLEDGLVRGTATMRVEH